MAQGVEFTPESGGDLEVVALMPDHIQEGLVAAELKVFARRIGAQRLVRLAVGIGPEMTQGRIRRRDPQRM